MSPVGIPDTVALLAAVAPLPIGALLVWSGALKLFGRHAAEVARRSALGKAVGAERAPGVHGVLGAVELGVAAALLAPVTPAVRALGAGAAVALSAGFVAYLAYARVAAPESSCGCLSEQQLPVRGRSIARAVVLLLLAGLAATAEGTWTVAGSSRPAVATALVLAVAALLAALSPELDRRWLLPLRRLRLRLSHPLAGSASTFEVPVESSVHQLTRSPAWAAAAEWVRSDVLDSWDDGQWRVLSYGASFRGRAVTAVFAVPRLAYEPDTVRGVLVDDDGAVVWEHRPLTLTPA